MVKGTGLENRPNVLLICVDHWPGLLLGAAGNEHILSPTLDHLCANGIRFSEAYSATPTCIPARRALMTGTRAETHGDRVFKETNRMDPRLPTMPRVFGDAGYQTYAVGKLHVYPQRSRIGFDEVILNEEGRHHLGGGKDDYELFLYDCGYAGQELSHAMGNNVYTVRPWHLPEQYHQTNWTTRNMCRVIQRRDPDRPAFWYCSYAAPHPPIVPPAEYLHMYERLGVDMPFIGEWAERFDDLPYALKLHSGRWTGLDDEVQVAMARMGFYAQCTYIDHQIRLLIGTLREEGLLDETIIMFTGDHGDMLGNHRQWAKPPMFEYSAKIPMILSPAAAWDDPGRGAPDRRFAELRDVMPTLLGMCDIPVPETVEGLSLVSPRTRDHLYAEHYEDGRSMRMVRKDRFKLIYYPYGNRVQLFDLVEDPREMVDISDREQHRDILEELTALLIDNMWGIDTEWVRDGRLVGAPEPEYVPVRERGLLGQRGYRV